jgi:integrase
MLCDTTGIEFMSEITHVLVKDFAYTIMGKMSLSTAKVKVAYIRGIVRKCENEGWIKKDGINFTTILNGMGEDVESAHEPFITKKEAQEILKYAKKCNDNMYLILALGFFAGLRKGESANLLLSEIDLDRNQVNINNHKEDASKGITYFRTKSGKNRSVPIKKELLPILKKAIPAVQGSYLIVSNQSRYPQFTLREWDYLKDYLKDKQYMSFFTCHTARHSFASWAAQAGISIYKIQKWLGHSTVEMTARKYAHLQINDDDIDRF